VMAPVTTVLNHRDLQSHSSSIRPAVCTNRTTATHETAEVVLATVSMTMVLFRVTRVHLQVDTNISNKHTVSIFRVEVLTEDGGSIVPRHLRVYEGS
jgi:hypothetical protein